uniref:Uncharacterized protein n=1 Tax=Solanum lycopersicum TaxID=4081 RepID=A0A3Q7EBG9_SOLLC
MHITATSEFLLLRWSSFVGAVQPHDFVVVVVVDLVVRTKVGLYGGCLEGGEEENEILLVVWASPEVATMMADGRVAKEGEQTKALAMSLMGVN